MAYTIGTVGTERPHTPRPDGQHPTVSGANFKDGTAITCAAGNWSGAATISYAYQWYVDGVSVGATGSGNTATYTLQAGDKTKKVSCCVTGTSNNADLVAESLQSGTAWTEPFICID